MATTAHLTPRRPPWTWPASVGGAALTLLLLLLVPAAWWRALAPGRAPRAVPAGEVVPDLWLVDLPVAAPPPPITVARDAAAPPPAVLDVDPDWWRRAWEGRLERDLRPAPALPDSLLPPVLVALYGARATLDLILAVPDSAVTARLWRLVQSERLTLDDLDGLYTAISRARAYADLKSREAAMYGEFRFETVPVPK